MINLTKADEHATIDLTKGAANAALEVRAQWVDNGDDNDGNDDLDLRCSILMPDEQMYLIDGEIRGDLKELPYAWHHGDVVSASVDAPGEEIITVAKDIAKRAGGPVALCFSVYSALNNGEVSVASLQPRMVMSYGDQVVQCQYDFRADKAARSENVYTYVIGYAIVTETEVVLAPSGKTSEPGSESTPWPYWQNSELELEVDGPAVFKGDQASQSETYNKKMNIKKRFANVGAKSGKKGFLSSLFG